MRRLPGTWDLFKLCRSTLMVSVVSATLVLVNDQHVGAEVQLEKQVSSLGELVTMFDSSSCKECHE